MGIWKKYFWKGVLGFILGLSFSLVTLTYKDTVILKNNLQTEFHSDVSVSDFIFHLDGTLIKDEKIDTTHLGSTKVKYYYKNHYGWPKSGSFNIEVVDTTKPVIMVSDRYIVTKGYNKKLSDVILCADEVDDNVVCKIEGFYDVNMIGSYPLKITATDSSGNQNEVEFTLKVINSTKEKTFKDSFVKYESVYQKHKSANTKIGLDISKWQGIVNFKKLKENHVEFVMLKLAGQTEIDGEIILDPYFYDNLESAIDEEIEVGVYFYSYAKNRKEAKKQAEYVMNAIKDYDITMPIAFDWENFLEYNPFHLSFYSLNSIAKNFTETVEKRGYDALLYSSKTYLDTIWYSKDYNIWLANYSNTLYEGDYKMWQVCSDGKIDGIDGYVDIDVYYQS